MVLVLGLLVVVLKLVGLHSLCYVQRGIIKFWVSEFSQRDEIGYMATEALCNEGFYVLEKVIICQIGP